MNENNVIQFPEMGNNTTKEAPVKNMALIERKHEAIKKLGGYRGDVPSRNTIRSLPNVRRGEIFWVEMDDKAYIVADIEGKKLTIKALDETASISIGQTIFEMNKGLVSKEPLFDWSDLDEVKKLNLDIEKWFDTFTEDTYYLLYGRDIHYVTLFKNARQPGPDILKILHETLDAVGDVISIDRAQMGDEKSLEIWMRTADSKAELLYLFPYDKGIVHI